MDTIRIDHKLEFLVPMALLTCEKYEAAIAGTALFENVNIVFPRNNSVVLLFRIGRSFGFRKNDLHLIGVLLAHGVCGGNPARQMRKRTKAGVRDKILQIDIDAVHLVV